MTRATIRARRSNAAGWLCLFWLFAGCQDMGCNRPAATSSNAPEQHEAEKADQQGPAQPRRVSFDPQGTGRLLVMQANGVTSVWHVADPKNPAKELEIVAPAHDVAFSVDGKSIFTTGRDGAVRRWTDGELVWRTPISHLIEARTIAVSPDGSVVAAGGDDGKIHLLTVDGIEIGSVDTGQEMVLSLAFSPKGDRLACDGSDTRIRMYRRIEAAPGIELENTFREPNERYANMLPNLIRLDVQWGWQESIAFSPDGSQMLIANLDGTCGFWTVEGKRHLRPFTNHGVHHIRAVAFSPLGNLVASGGFDGRVQLWTTNGATTGHPLTAHNDVITSIAFSPDGKMIATAGIDSTVRLWNTKGARLGMLPRNRTPYLPRSKGK